MSNTDIDSFAPDLPTRGNGQVSNTGKVSLSTGDAALHLMSGSAWSRSGTPATVTYAFRHTGTSPDSDSTGFSPFNAAQITQAEKALTAWSDVANITFVRVQDGDGYSDNATILFGNYTDGPAAGFTYYPGQAGVGSVSGDVWINGSLSYNAAPTTGNYGGQVLVHEIGHAIGLSHPSDYDVDTNPSYYANAGYSQDSRQYTVMSYFDEFNTGASFAGNYSAVPLIDDITAAQRLYGANMTTRTGDTSYGFGSNADREWYVATSASSKLVMAVWDAGGNDTFNFIGYNVSQSIDLRQGAFSSVGGLTGNVAIAYGTVIENAIGGSGSDTIVGNSADNILNGSRGNDKLFGEAGNDTLFGGDGSDTLDGGSGTNVIDGGADSDWLTLPGTYSDYYSVLNSDGSLTIRGNNIVDTVSGIETITTQAIGALNTNGRYTPDSFLAATNHPIVVSYKYAGLADFNGDGRSDILWRNADGDLTTWQAGTNATAFQHGVYYTSVDPGWQVADLFDMNGDGRTDILWRHAGGTLSVWTATGNGGFAGTLADGSVGNDWSIVAAGDYNGDGKDDILWRQTSGAVSVWQSTGTGFNGTYYHAPIGLDWKIVGSGDFNGDGRDDVLWRQAGGAVTTWSGTQGGFTENSFYDASVGNDWHIAGIGDFNGDGQDDVFWHSDSGALSLWEGASGHFNGVYYDASVGPDWQIVQIGDFNGDDRADILWRQDGGALSIWLADGNGFNKSVFYDASVGTSSGWSVVSHDFA